MSTADDGRRLLMVAPSAVPGGMEEIFFILAVNLAHHGVHVDVLSLQDGPLIDRFRRHGVPVRVIDAGRLREPRAFGRTVRALAGQIDRGGYDAVFSNMAKAHLYVAPAARRHRVPALWCQAGYPDPAHWLDRIASVLPAATVIALSSDAVQAQRRLTGDRCPVRTLHPGIEVERFTARGDAALRAEHGIPADAPLVSLVGRLQAWKGQREFLQAAALLAGIHPEARFAIVGGAILGWEGDYPQQLTALATSLGLDGRVIFTGHTDAVPGWMAASDVVVNASSLEPFGMVVIEAMATACAVVAVARGGPRDIIEPDRSGVLCPDNSPAALAHAIGPLIEDPARRARLGRAARERVRERFTETTMTAAFAAIVADAVAAAPR